MTSKQTYNGWVNWETWNYNLMFCDGNEIYDLGWYHGEDCEYYTKPYSVYDIADYVKDLMEQLYDEIEENIFSSFTRSALSKVSFFEIAENLYGEYIEGYEEGKNNKAEEEEEGSAPEPEETNNGVEVVR